MKFQASLKRLNLYEQNIKKEKDLEISKLHDELDEFKNNRKK